jgi:hypothetical protein
MGGQKSPTGKGERGGNSTVTASSSARKQERLIASSPEPSDSDEADSGPPQPPIKRSRNSTGKNSKNNSPGYDVNDPPSDEPPDASPLSGVENRSRSASRDNNAAGGDGEYNDEDDEEDGEYDGEFDADGDLDEFGGDLNSVGDLWDRKIADFGNATGDDKSGAWFIVDDGQFECIRCFRGVRGISI